MKTSSIETSSRFNRPILRGCLCWRRAIVATSIAGMLTGVSISQADIIEFDLSPAGSGGGVGLSPANEVPPSTSTGSGNEISAGITFDTDTSTLSLAIGYGSAAGFTGLSGAVTGLHIHGPAAAGTNAGVLFNLSAIHFPSAVPATGGVIFGSVVYTPAQAADLLAGLNYVNLHTAANPGGEIRGQLIPLLNAAPEVTCPADATVECGLPFTYTATVTDAEGEAMQVVWSLNGNPVQTDELGAGGPPSGGVVEFTTSLPLGLNVLTVTASDSFGNEAGCSANITAEDTIAPVITSVSATPSVLWSPNHKMVPIQVSAEVFDACGETTWRIVSIESNEAVDAIGSGNTSPDWVITGDSTAEVRAERSGTNKSGRVYTIRIQAEDSSGNLSDPVETFVAVPHSQGKSSIKRR